MEIFLLLLQQGSPPPSRLPHPNPHPTHPHISGPAEPLQGWNCRTWQAGVAVMGASMLLLLRSHPLGKPILPLVGGQSGGPKLL
jgi:hypothetical protein